GCALPLSYAPVRDAKAKALPAKVPRYKGAAASKSRTYRRRVRKVSARHRREQPLGHLHRQLVEMRDDARGREGAHVKVGIAEIDGHDRDAGGLGRVDVGARIADHDRARRVAAGAADGFGEMARVGLAEGEGVGAADGGEAR